MMQKKDNGQIMRKFELLQGRQLLAIAATLCSVIILAVVSKRPDLFGEFSKNTVLTLQIAVIGAFLGFSALNWRCPSCKKYLGYDINKRICRTCGTRFR